MDPELERAGDVVSQRAQRSNPLLIALQRNIERLNREPNRAPSPVFGAMTREEWDQLHLRHAELHLSFYVPE